MVYRSQSVFNRSDSIARLYNRKVGADPVLVNKPILHTVTPREAISQGCTLCSPGITKPRSLRAILWQSSDLLHVGSASSQQDV